LLPPPTLLVFSLFDRDVEDGIRDEEWVELSSTLFLAVVCPVEEDDEDSKRGNISTLIEFSTTIIIVYVILP
jgi:hypothetical protein